MKRRLGESGYDALRARALSTEKVDVFAVVAELEQRWKELA